MIAPVDLADLLNHQKLERYRAILVTGPPASGKSNYARKLAKRITATYIDVLHLFTNDPQLSANIDTFSHKDLLRLILQQSPKCDIVIVDNCDFLVNTWSDSERKEFGQWLGKLNNVQCPLVLCFFLQYDNAFDDLSFTPTNDGHSRILHFENLVTL